MIFDWIIAAFVMFIDMIINFLPSLPPMPDIALNITDWIMTSIENTSGVIKWLYGSGVYHLILFLMTSIFFFKPAFSVFMWIKRFIRS